jgi:hypothetical protein
LRLSLQQLRKSCENHAGTSQPERLDRVLCLWPGANSEPQRPACRQVSVLNDGGDGDRPTAFRSSHVAVYAPQFGVTCSPDFSPPKTCEMVEVIEIEQGCGDAVGLRPERVPR